MLPCDHRKFENSIDPLLGYPPAFASLCSHSIFSLSPSFLPYHLSPKQIATCKGLDALFPAITQSIENEETMASLRRNQGGFLWAQLNHLGNAGFDPAEFRIDPFGNVLQWAAPPFSPLAWDVDHWFPLSRGGKTVARNLRLIQWQVREQKGQRLEFLMPWWDFQLGISVNQFLLIYASKHADFRNRAFSWLYGSDHHHHHHHHHHEIKHSWPAHFKRRAEQHGYAAAGIVNVSEIQNKSQPDSNAWPCEVNNNREDVERKAMLLNAIEVQQKQEEVSMIEKELKIIKDRNERESVALEELENTLARHKKQLEKQRMWSETQSHYRQCLERVIRDTLHQNIIYREQARLNRAACGALLAKIQSHKVNAKDVEINLIKQLKHREALEVLAAEPDSEFSAHTNLLVDQKDGFDTGLRSLTDPPNMVTDKILGVDNAGDGKGEEKRSTDVLVKRSSDINSLDASSKPPMDTIMEEEDSIEEAKVGGESQSVSPLKRKVGSDPDVRHGFQRQRIESNGLIYGRDESLNDVKVSHVKVRRQGQQLEDVLQEALTLKSSQQLHDADGYGDTNGFFVSGNGTSGLETEEQRTNRLGKSNVEKWLHRLLLNTNASDQPSSHDSHDERRLSDAAAVGLKKDRYLDVKKHEDGDSMRNELEKPRKVLDGLFRMVSFRHDHARKLKTSKDRTKSGQDDNVMRDGGSHNEAEEEIHCMQENVVEVLNDSSEASNDSLCDVVVPSDIDFVKKMKDLREVEKKKRSCLSSQQSRPLLGHHQENKDDDIEGLRAFTAIQNLNPTNTKSFPSESKRGACQDQLKRSLSMRALTTTSGERCNDMAMHTRRGSDMLTSSWLSSSILEEDDDHDHDHDPMESILQPSWSMRGEKDDGHNKSTSGGLKASLRTCTKAVKHAVSKRRSNKL